MQNVRESVVVSTVHRLDYQRADHSPSAFSLVAVGGPANPSSLAW